ncbi:MAG: hypothetical protein RIR66_512, partial [Actinomycetota bacterium]
MRVLIAPDCFTGTLTSAQAAKAMASGWLQEFPEDQIELAPLSDGGPGFVSAIIGALGAQEIPAVVTGPLGQKVLTQFAMLGNQAWIESAQACGLALIDESSRNPELTTTFGVGELLIAAIESGATKITIGLGGSGTNDGGAGMLGALGAIADIDLKSGGLALKQLSDVDLSAAKVKLAGI